MAHRRTTASEVAMPYRELLPHPALRPFVDRFWVSRAEAGAPPRRVLPDGCIDLLLDLTGDRGAMAVGTMTRAIVFHPRTAVRTAAVRFRPGGAVRFLGVAAEELTDRVVDCADAGAAWLQPAFLSASGEPAVAVTWLERRLLERLRTIEAPDPIVAYAVSALLAPAPPSMETLSRKTGWSRQHLTRAFRFHVGIGPKQLARVGRLQRTVAHLQSGAHRGLASAAVRFGYFDQAHMGRDFRELVGVTALVTGSSAGSIFPIQSVLGDG